MCKYLRTFEFKLKNQQQKHTRMQHFTTVSIIHLFLILNGLNGSINDYITSFEFEAISLPSVITYLNIRSQF